MTKVIITSVIIPPMEFIDWLIVEMNRQGLSQNELAHKSGISQSAINHILSKRRGVGEKTIRGLARGLGLPVQEVYRRAGLLPPKSPHEEQIERIYYKLSTLEDDDRKQVEEYIEFMLQRNEGAGKKSNDDRQGRTGEVD